MCLIPKSECGKYHDIVLLEVMYKIISMIINVCIEDPIQFHAPGYSWLLLQALHRYVYLEAKLEMLPASSLYQACIRSICISQNHMICETILIHCPFLRLKALCLTLILFINWFGNGSCYFQN